MNVISCNAFISSRLTKFFSHSTLTHLRTIKTSQWSKFMHLQWLVYLIAMHRRCEHQNHENENKTSAYRLFYRNFDIMNQLVSFIGLFEPRVRRKLAMLVKTEWKVFDIDSRYAFLVTTIAECGFYENKKYPEWKYFAFTLSNSSNNVDN